MKVINSLLQMRSGLIVLLLLLTACSKKEPVSSSSATSTNAAVVQGSAKTDANVISYADINNLVTEYTDKKSGKAWQFDCNFEQYSKSGDKPGLTYRITCSLNEVKTVKGQVLTKRESGMAHIFIKDSNGNLVENKAISLDKMCPS